MKLEHIVVYGNNLDEFNIGHVPLQSKNKIVIPE